jgi:Asp-tRNA(Asn)/Glu-tRNA(Gln) amidotransferase A subunit family amidase
MIAVVPESIILDRAAYLDEERRAGRVLGPLHGIPIILKVFNPRDTVIMGSSK